MSLRKTRPDAFWHALKPEQIEQLCDWLPTMGYRAVRSLMEKEWNVRVRSDASLHAFWEQVYTPWLLQRRGKARSAAQSLADDAAQNPFADAALWDAIKQKFFELTMQPNPDPSALATLANMALKVRAQDLQAQQLDLQRRRVELLESQAASAKETLDDSTLSPEAREQRMREIFGMPTGGAN